MAFSRVTRIILYVVAGISLLVILFYYVSPKTINYDALEMRVDEATNPADMAPVAPLPTVDSTTVDSTAVDSTANAAMASNAQGPSATITIEETQDVNLRAIMSGYEYLVWFRTDIALIWAYILVALTLLASIVFPLISVFSNPKALIRLLAILAGAAVLVIVSYLLSSDKPIDIIGYTGTDNSDPATLKMIDTVLFVTYILFGMAIASILYAIVSRAFK